MTRLVYQAASVNSRSNLRPRFYPRIQKISSHTNRVFLDRAPMAILSVFHVHIWGKSAEEHGCVDALRSSRCGEIRQPPGGLAADGVTNPVGKPATELSGHASWASLGWLSASFMGLLPSSAGLCHNLEKKDRSWQKHKAQPASSRRSGGYCHRRCYSAQRCSTCTASPVYH